MTEAVVKAGPGVGVLGVVFAVMWCGCGGGAGVGYLWLWSGLLQLSSQI